MDKRNYSTIVSFADVLVILSRRKRIILDKLSEIRNKPIGEPITNKDIDEVIDLVKNI